MNNQLIIDFAKSIGIEKVGFTKYPQQTSDGQWRKEAPMSAVVCLFPYYSGVREGANLSVYTYSRDYHIIVMEKLGEIEKFIKRQDAGAHTRSYVDTGPRVDKMLAYSAGLGFYGLNSLIINEKFGSFVFIGYVLCDIEFDYYSDPLGKTCKKCGRCIKSCPGGAIRGDGTIDASKCASAISQKRGELTEEEKEILKKSSLVFGCDICQLVCPHNNIIPRPMEEFTRDIKAKITLDEIEGLADSQFKEIYADRAFSWRGKAVLERNLKVCN